MGLVTTRWIIVWIFFSSLNSATGLKCFSCDSEFMKDCRKFKQSQTLLRSCDASKQPVFCQKIERKLNESEDYRVIRGCVYEEQITLVSMECQATGSTSGEHNVYICSSDGCNSGSILNFSFISLFILTAYALTCSF